MYYKYLSWNFPNVPVSVTYICTRTVSTQQHTCMYVTSCEAHVMYIIRYIHTLVDKFRHTFHVWAHDSRSRWTHAWTWREAWAGREAKHRFTREGTRLTFFSDVSRRWHVSRKLDSRVGAHVSRWRPHHCQLMKGGSESHRPQAGGRGF